MHPKYQYVFTKECPGNQTMIIRRMLQLFNLIFILLDKNMDLGKWDNKIMNKKNLSYEYENLMMGYSKFKIESYPEIENLISSYLTKNSNRFSLQQKVTSELLYKLWCQKLSILISTMKTLVIFSSHSQIKNYISHHLYDNSNNSYTTFIHQPSCNALLCQHQSYLDRECLCKFLLCVNRWFFIMAKIDGILSNNYIVNNLLHEITKDINISGNI